MRILTPDGLTPLPSGKINVAVEVLHRAFEGDPCVERLAVNPERASQHARYLFSFFLRHYLRHGVVHAVSPNVEGLAMWSPPGREAMTLSRLMASNVPSLVWNIGPRGLWRLIRFGDRLTAMRKRVIEKPHWYLAFLAVDPTHQGKGYAGRLLRPMLASAEAEGFSCYLETTNPANPPVYRHFGFEVAEEATLDVGDLRVWAMLRT